MSVNAMTTWVSLRSRHTDAPLEVNPPVTRSGGSATAAIPCSEAELKVRPGAARRERLLATETGRTLYRDTRVWIAKGLSDYGLESLSALRLRQGLAQADLVERSGIPQPQISRIENGKHPDIDLSTAVALAHALGVSLDEFTAAFKATNQGRDA